MMPVGCRKPDLPGRIAFCFGGDRIRRMRLRAK